MVANVRRAAVLLPAGQARPPLCGQVLAEAVKAVAVSHGGRLWERVDVWTAGAGRIVPFRHAKDLPPEDSLDSERQPTFAKRLLSWLREHQAEYFAAVAYARKESPLGAAFERALREDDDMRSFAIPIWCENYVGLAQDVVPELYEDPDHCLVFNANLAKLVRFLGEMLLSPDEWPSPS